MPDIQEDLGERLDDAPTPAGPNLARLGVFVGLLVVFGSLVVAVAQVTGVGIVALAPLYMWTPLAAAVVVVRMRRLPVGSLGLRIGRWRRLVGVALLAQALVVACLVVAVLTPGVDLDLAAEPMSGGAWPDGPLGILAAVGLALVLGVTVNAVVALGEEVGWRGYLLRELAPLGFWKASWVTGAIWGVWHAPIILAGYNFPNFPLAGVVVMTLACIAFAPLFTLVTVRARSVLAPTILHGVFNGSAGSVLVYTSTDHPALADLVANPVGLAGIIVFGVVALAIARRGAPTLDRLHQTS